MVKVGFVKIGNLGISQIVDLALDERAERDILTRTISTGPKTTPEQALDAIKMMLDFAPDLVIIVTPTTSLLTSGTIKALRKPYIIISAAPAKKAVNTLKKDGCGYIILTGDALIGARREFLDSTEMALFNSDVLRVLTICGAVQLVQEEMDAVITQIQHGKKIMLPQIIADASVAVDRAKFSNPYAKAKALAAYQMAEKVAEINTRACFIISNVKEYTMTAASAHELMRVAALLADEAREMEKCGDAVLRRPHDDSGAILSKVRLLDKPRKGGD
ncbi:MAG: F420-dependent methylenetetrahydromethanopterin dehydrogenase [Candidatus Methanospirareceae archaeon]